MKRRNYLTTFFAGLLILSSCDKVDKPLDTGAAFCDPNVVVPRKVLIEDFTGHLCNNCPAASDAAAAIVNDYGDKVIVIAAHVTSTFARPLLTSSEWANSGVPDSSFMTDFRTPAGNAYLSQFTPSGLPTGLVSRVPFNNSYTIGVSSWSSAVFNLVCTEAAVQMEFSNVSYNAASREIDVQIDATLRNDLAGDYSIVVCLTENDVVDWQLDERTSPPYVSNYVHKHALRDNLNGTWGTNVISGSGSVGDIVSVNVDNYVLDSGWEAGNCSLVAYIYDESDYEILQVEEVHLDP
jgi:hypothetical protein